MYIQAARRLLAMLKANIYILKLVYYLLWFEMTQLEFEKFLLKSLFGMLLSSWLFMQPASIHNQDDNSIRIGVLAKHL